MIGVLILVTITILLLARAGGQNALAILWLIGFFVLRNARFALFEIGGRRQAGG